MTCRPRVSFSAVPVKTDRRAAVRFFCDNDLRRFLMRFTSRALSLLLVLGTASIALAVPESPARGATVDDIVAKNIAARGGEAKLKAIKSLRLTGKGSFSFGDNQIDISFGQVQKRPGMIRTETTLQGLTAVEATDGKQAWNLQPFQGRRDAQTESADETRQVG